MSDLKDWTGMLATLAIVAAPFAVVLWLVSGMTFWEAWFVTTSILVVLGIVDSLR